MLNEDKMPVNILGNFNILKKADDGKRIIAGYASVVEVDQQNHIIPKATLEDGVKSLLKDTNYSNLMLVHKNIQIGKILPSFNDIATHVDDKGLFIVAEIRNDLEIANKVWDAIIQGNINSFSISGEVLLDHKECDETKCVRIIDKINIFEVSVCSCPVNKDSGFVVVSKGDTVCNDVNIQILNMSRENMGNNEPKTPCVDCTPPQEPIPEVAKKADVPTPPQKEFNIQEAFDSLSREIIAIKGIIEEMKAKKPVEEPVPAEPVPPAAPVPPVPEEEEKPPFPKSEEPAPVVEDQVNLAEYTNFIENYLKANPKKTALDGAIQWKSRKTIPIPEKKAKEPEVPNTPPVQAAIVEPSNYASKTDFDELKKSFDNLTNIITKNKKLEEMEIIVKSKDDEIAGLVKRVEVLSKAEVDPKTTVDEPKKETVMSSDNKDPVIVRDTREPGVFYMDPDLM